MRGRAFTPISVHLDDDGKLSYGEASRLYDHLVAAERPCPTERSRVWRWTPSSLRGVAALTACASIALGLTIWLLAGSQDRNLHTPRSDRTQTITTSAMVSATPQEATARLSFAPRPALFEGPVDQIWLGLQDRNDTYAELLIIYSNGRAVLVRRAMAEDNKRNQRQVAALLHASHIDPRSAHGGQDGRLVTQTFTSQGN
jgi:hypothetical protein